MNDNNHLTEFDIRIWHAIYLSNLLFTLLIGCLFFSHHTKYATVNHLSRSKPIHESNMFKCYLYADFKSNGKINGRMKCKHNIITYFTIIVSKSRRANG